MILAKIWNDFGKKPSEMLRERPLRRQSRNGRTRKSDLNKKKNDSNIDNNS